MKKTTKIVTLAMTLIMAAAGSALATPSTQIWIPSTDIQSFGSVHLGIDNYIRTSNKGGFPNYYDLGVTVGVLPFDKIQMEVGVDYLEGGQGGLSALGGTDVVGDKHPIYFNAKIGTPEDSLFKYSPAIAVGAYNVGTATPTQQNLVYGLVAKTLPVIGRLSAGGYHGAERVLGSGQSDGVLASWDRTISELSDKLWVGVDYMSGNNFNGSVNFGVSWAFSKNVSVIVGYDIYNNPALAGKNTFNTQLDINFP